MPTLAIDAQACTVAASNIALEKPRAKWTPANLTTDQAQAGHTQVWYDVPSAENIITSGKMETLIDLVSTRDLTNTDAAKRPTVNATGLNGMRTITFSTTSSTHLHRDEANNTLRAKNSGTVCVVCRFNTPTPAAENMLFGVRDNSGASGTRRIAVRQLTTGIRRASASRTDSGTEATVDSAGADTNGWHVTTVVADYSGGTLSQYINGTLNGYATPASFTGATSNTSSGRVRMGSSTGNTPASFANADVAELVMYADDVLAVLRQRLEGYLHHRWGLANNLATDHPFKYTPPLLDVTLSVTSAACVVTPHNIRNDVRLSIVVHAVALEPKTIGLKYLKFLTATTQTFEVTAGTPLLDRTALLVPVTRAIAATQVNVGLTAYRKIPIASALVTSVTNATISVLRRARLSLASLYTQANFQLVLLPRPRRLAIIATSHNLLIAPVNYKFLRHRVININTSASYMAGTPEILLPRRYTFVCTSLSFTVTTPAMKSLRNGPVTSVPVAVAVQVIGLLQRDKLVVDAASYVCGAPATIGLFRRRTHSIAPVAYTATFPLVGVTPTYRLFVTARTVMVHYGLVGANWFRINPATPYILEYGYRVLLGAD